MATTYDKASLVMIPSGYKDDKLYSVKPTDGSGDFTFSRDGAGASPATRVNASGLIEKGRENVLTYSNTFSNAAWTKSNSSVTGGQSGYDGSSDAWLLESTSTSGAFAGQSATTSGVRTDSVYAKAGNVNWVRFSTAAFGNGAYFDLQNGVVGTTASVIDAVIEGVGSGWYRLSITHIGTTGIFIFPAVANNTLTSTSGQNIYIQDAQLEQGLISTDYIETTTAAVSAGLLGDMPRLDYSGGATCPSLLLEPSRVNVFTHSEYFGGWSLGGSTTPTLTPNYATSPEGVQNAYRVQLPNLATDSVMFQLISHTTGVDMSISAWVKSASGTDEVFKLYGDYGTPTGRSSQFTATSEWQRFEFTYTATATGNRGAGLISINNTASDLLVYGFQIEQASYPTSYIPTYGSASTRGEEGGQVTSVSDLVGQTQGTLFAEVDSFGVGEVANRIFGVSNGASAERVIMLTRSNGFRFIVTNSSVNNVDYTKYITTDGVHKLAITYDANESRIFVDGVKVHTDSSVTLPSSLNSVHIGKQEINGDYGNNFGGSAKQALVFKTALTDAECIALTTI